VKYVYREGRQRYQSTTFGQLEREEEEEEKEEKEEVEEAQSINNSFGMPCIYGVYGGFQSNSLHCCQIISNSLLILYRYFY